MLVQRFSAWQWEFLVKWVRECPGSPPTISLSAYIYYHIYMYTSLTIIGLHRLYMCKMEKNVAFFTHSFLWLKQSLEENDSTSNMTRGKNILSEFYRHPSSKGIVSQCCCPNKSKQTDRQLLWKQSALLLESPIHLVHRYPNCNSLELFLSFEKVND